MVGGGGARWKLFNNQIDNAIILFLSLGEQDDSCHYSNNNNYYNVVLCPLITTMVTSCSVYILTLCMSVCVIDVSVAGAIKFIDSMMIIDSIRINTKHNNVWNTIIVCAGGFESVVQLVLAMWVRY